ncbi:hypothetical protein PIB30_085440 [Stylosanthes scabra]|uniref:Uncharacterized protein n=1 Tax=Stylosanthes scabra TaxID=79078 RepID=A0ABU6STE6_9FABA|nr:hypothetical protein [Stylosanthes scabra]
MGIEGCAWVLKWSGGIAFARLSLESRYRLGLVKTLLELTLHCTEPTLRAFVWKKNEFEALGVDSRDLRVDLIRQRPNPTSRPLREPTLTLQSQLSWEQLLFQLFLSVTSRL